MTKEIKKYRKKPVVIEAYQWKGWKNHPGGEGGHDPFNVVKKLPPLKFFIIGLALGSYEGTCGHSPHRLGWIQTLEGGHIVVP